MNSSILGQVLGGIFSNAVRGRAGGGAGGGPGGGMGGGLGDILGGMMGRGSATAERGSPFGGTGGAIIGMLLPLAMQWVQRNGGLGAVLGRMQQKGYSQQAASWVSTGPNEALNAEAIGDVVGNDELSRLSQQLNVPQQEVANGFAQILPEMVNHLTPDGRIPDNVDGVLDDGLLQLQGLIRELQRN